MRQVLITYQDLLLKFKELKAKVGKHDQSISQIFAYLKQLLQEQSEPREPIDLNLPRKNNLLSGRSRKYGAGAIFFIPA